MNGLNKIYLYKIQIIVSLSDNKIIVSLSDNNHWQEQLPL